MNINEKIELEEEFLPLVFSISSRLFSSVYLNYEENEKNINEIRNKSNFRRKINKNNLTAKIKNNSIFFEDSIKTKAEKNSLAEKNSFENFPRIKSKSLKFYNKKEDFKGDFFKENRLKLFNKEKNEEQDKIIQEKNKISINNEKKDSIEEIKENLIENNLKLTDYFSEEIPEEENIFNLPNNNNFWTNKNDQNNLNKKNFSEGFNSFENIIDFSDTSISYKPKQMNFKIVNKFNEKSNERKTEKNNKKENLSVKNGSSCIIKSDYLYKRNDKYLLGWQVI